jgi:hypothetical protein
VNDRITALAEIIGCVLAGNIASEKPAGLSGSCRTQFSRILLKFIQFWNVQHKGQIRKIYWVF